MKKLLAGLVLFSAVHAKAQLLKVIEVPIGVQIAAAVIYDYGRYVSDSGGISHIQRFENEKSLNSFRVVRELIDKGLLITSEMACEQASNANECSRMVVERDPIIMPSTAFTVSTFLSELATWNIDESRSLKAEVETISAYIRQTFPDGFSEYKIGYDYVADTFDFILISKDRKTIVIVSGDYGA